MLVKTRGGLIINLDDHRAQIKIARGQVTVPTETELQSWNHKFNPPADLKWVFTPYWQDDKPWDGYGSAYIEMREAMSTTGFAFANNIENATEKFILVFHTPDMPKLARETWGPEYKIISFTMHESTVFPPHWIDNLQTYADVIIVPSVWNKKVLLQQGVTKPIHVVPLAYHQVFRYLDRPNFMEGAFTFLNYNAGNTRKAFPVYIDAFKKAFGNTNAVRFILKTYAKNMERSIREYLKTYYPDNQNIELIAENMDRPQMVDLAKKAHCFVFPSRGEGFGLPPIEMMMTGIPCILPKAHAFEDYWNDACIESDWKYTRSMYPHGETFNLGCWFEPDIDSLVEKMKWAVENRGQLQTIGRKGHEFLKDRFSIKTTVEKLAWVFQNLETPDDDIKAGDFPTADEPERTFKETDSKPNEIVMVTGYTPNIEEYAKPAAKIKSEYCDHYGYKFLEFTQENDFDPERDATWSKVKFILDAMKLPEVKWVFWTDADAIITNTQINLESFIDESYNLIISQDPNGINAGNFFIRNCEWSKKLLEEMWKQKHLSRELFHEQSALINCRQQPYFNSQIKVVSQIHFNSYDYTQYQSTFVPLDRSWEATDFMLHLPGVSSDKRISIFNTIYSNYESSATVVRSVDTTSGNQKPSKGNSKKNSGVETKKLQK